MWRGLPQLLAVVDRDGRLGATNPAWQRLLGLSAQQLRGQPLLARVHADDLAAARCWMDRVIGGAGGAQFSGRWRRADGSHLRLQWTLAPSDGLGCAIGEPAPAPTRPAVPQPPPQPHTQTNAQAQQQTLRSVARLSGGLSHDFNNLLQVLRNMLELIHQRPGEPGQVAEWAASALRVVDRGAHLTTRLLAFTGTQRLSPQTVQVHGLLQSLKGPLQARMGPHIRLQLDPAADSSLATADAGQLEQAVLNLALNAIDAMPQGGKLSITPGRAHVEDDPELATGDYISIDVGDTGTGMSRTVRERAFEPFFTTKALGRGSGLGLSQVYGFMRQTGGAVRILAPAGPGCTVRLLLPAAAAPLPQAGPAASGSATPAAYAEPGQPRVLVVMDDPERRQRLLSALNLLGYSCVQTVDAAGAAQQLEQHTPDVVVLGLPARPVDPDDLARRARRLRPGAGVVRLDALATAPHKQLDMHALAESMGRAANDAMRTDAQ